MKTQMLWILCSLIILQPLYGAEEKKPALRDGQHDFDFHIGTWKTHLKRLQHPLTGSKNWVEYEGTTVVRKVWNGRANLVELVADGPAGHFEGLSLRLYDPEAHQWSLNFANIKSGTLTLPAIGEFKNGRGEFYNTDTLNGRSILVRFIISDITANSIHFEQSFSDDGGKTWEVNWIATDTRLNKSEIRAWTQIPQQSSTDITLRRSQSQLSDSPFCVCDADHQCLAEGSTTYQVPSFPVVAM
jgi:hypothetical protein